MTWPSRLRLRLSTGRQLRELQADILTEKSVLVRNRVDWRTPEYVELDERLVDVLRERLWRDELRLCVRRVVRWRRG